MKSRQTVIRKTEIFVAPARERGLKFVLFGFLLKLRSRSREGAWIEMDSDGLKLTHDSGRSREGAWIEIKADRHQKDRDFCRSREGAWIEIDSPSASPRRARRRSREGAWIEIIVLILLADRLLSLPRGSVD